jgi:hypothetical protein
MIARELAVIFGLETKKEDFDKVNQNIEGIKDAAHRFLEVYVGEKILHGLIDSFREFGETSREIMDAQLFGLNTTQYQVLQQGAQMFGVQRQRFDMGIALMQRNAYEASRGNKEAAMSFAQLGVNVMDNNGKLKNTKDLLYQIADGMKRFKDDPATRVALGEKLFGMRDIEFQNLLLKGSEGMQALERDAKSLGFVMGEAAVAAGKRFNEQMIRVQFIIDGLRNKIMSALAPVINELVDKIIAWVKANQKLLDQKIKEFAQGLIDVVVTLAGILKNISVVLLGLAGIVGGVSAALKILIYTFLAMKALDMAVGIFKFVEGFVALAKVIKAAAIAMGIFDGTLALSPIGAFIAALTALYFALKYIYDLIWGSKANSVDINAINQGNAGVSGYIAGQGSRLVSNSSSKQSSVVLSPRYEINVKGGDDAKQIGKNIKEAMEDHTNSLIKDLDRKTSYLQNY